MAYIALNVFEVGQFLKQWSVEYCPPLQDIKVEEAKFENWPTSKIWAVWKSEYWFEDIQLLLLWVCGWINRNKANLV